MKTKYNSTQPEAAFVAVPCDQNANAIGLTPVKTRTQIAGLTVALLVGAALTSAAIDFKPPDTSGFQKQMEDAQNQLDKANSAPAKLTANPQTVQIPAGQNAASTRLSWSIGSGRSIIVLRVKGTDGVSTDLQTLPSVPGPGFISQPQGTLTVPVKPGKNVFSLNEAGKRLALVTVEGVQSSPSSSSSGNEPQPPSTNRATITANPGVVTIPAGQKTGSTTLTWDGGKDHPYAEVWVKVDDNDETYIIEQGKGSRRVNVRLGETYLYILTDAGQRLSTVSVTTK